MTPRRAAALVLVLAVARAEVALGCKLAVPPAHVLDAAVDSGTEPPEPPSSVTATVERGTGPRANGCDGMMSTSCDDVGSITLRIQPGTDDRTPVAKLGYRVIVTGGTTPPGVSFSDGSGGAGAVLADADGVIHAHWIDGATDEQEPVDFTIVVVAVDAAGNESDPSPEVRVYDPGEGDSGCAMRGAPRSDVSLGALPVAALGLLVARRRRQGWRPASSSR